MNKRTKASGTSMPVNTPLDDNLSESALGAWISENKGLSLTIVGLIFASIIGYGGWVMIDSKKSEAASEAVYSFENEVLAPYSQGNFDSNELVNRWNQLSSDHSGRKEILPSFLFVIDQLIDSEQYTQARDLLEANSNRFRGDFVNYFIEMRKAVVYEDLGEIDQAISTLESLSQSSLDLLESKVYLDLGRLYKKQGDYNKARASFEYVVSNMAQEEFAQLARVYLGQLEENQ